LFDDSSGELGSFLNDLGMPLAEALLSLNLDESESEDINDRLELRHKKLEEYGIEGLGVAISASRYGWDFVDDTELNEVKLNILDHRGNIDGFFELCVQSGNYLRMALKLLDLGRMDEAMKCALKNLTYAEEALTVAEKLQVNSHLDRAITIAERGLSLQGAKFSLGSWLGPLEEVQGRNEQALTAYQAAFDEAPSLELYRSIQRLASQDWPLIQPAMMERLRDSVRSEALVEVLLYERDWDEALEVADAEKWNYRLVEKVVEAVTPYRPEWAIVACRLQAEQLIEKKQSQYYTIAGRWLVRMKYAYSLLGQQADWEAYLSNLRDTYARRPSLQEVLRYI
jgi:uncharacterized Zn finger protein